MTAVYMLWMVFGLIVTAHFCCATFEENQGRETLRVTQNGFEKCKDIDVKQLQVKGKACIVITYFPSEMGLEVNITWNGESVFHTKISAKRPSALCFKLPGVLKGVEVCLKLTDLSFKPHHHGACLELTVKALMFHKTFKLGCIYKSLKKTGTVLTEGYKATKETGMLSGGWSEPRSQRPAKSDKKTGHQGSEWTELTESLGSDIKSKQSSPAPAGKCTCPKARNCMCCSTVPKTKTTVCGRVSCSKTGKGFWLGLFVNKNKNFRVYSPVSRLFTMACGDPRITKITTSTCLQLFKVTQSSTQIKGCLRAHIISKTPHTHLDLGCFTLTHHKICTDKSTDEEIRFVPPRVHDFGPIFI